MRRHLKDNLTLQIMKNLISIIAISLLLATALLSSGCKTQEPAPDAETKKPSTEELAAAAEQRYKTLAVKKLQTVYTNNPKTMQLKDPESGEEIAVIHTTHGDIHIRLFPEVAPKTVENFKELTAQDKYIDVPFHRIIKNFMIQTGDFENGNGTGGHSHEGPGTTVPDEPSEELEHLYGAVSMAKTAAPNSGGSQFFIVHNASGTPHLNGAHTVFGQVINGMNVVEKIADEKTMPGDRPLNEVLIKMIKITEYEGA